MEEWDAISQSITHTNQVRAFAERDAAATIDMLLEAIEATKKQVAESANEEEGTSIARILESLASACVTSEVVSRKRYEGVHSAVIQLKQSVTRVLEPEQERDDIGVTSMPQEQRTLVDRALVWHFLHEGYLETAKAFSKEANLMSVPEVDIVRAKAGFEAAEAMASRRDLASAISWVEEYSAQTSPNLLFDLHKLRFLQLAASQSEAIGYAQRHLARFNASRAQEIHSLLGSLILHGQTAPHQSVIAGQNDAVAWEAARESLLSEIKRPYGSISVLLGSGLGALPELRTYQRLVAQGSRITSAMWGSGNGELPIHIAPLAHFHSEFCCPVSREQADSLNPPMMLACGHVIAKNSVARIAKHRQRFKCPTCPTEQSVDSPTVVHF